MGFVHTIEAGHVQFDQKTLDPILSRSLYNFIPLSNSRIPTSCRPERSRSKVNMRENRVISSLRLVGLTPLMTFKCPNYWSFEAPDKQSWTYYVNFVFVFVLYHLLVFQFRWTRMGVRYGCETAYSEDSSVHQEVSNRGLTIFLCQTYFTPCNFW